MNLSEEVVNNNIFITGKPRTGKSTMINDIIQESGLEAAGLRTPEIREGCKRKGFKLVDVATGKEGILSHVDQEEGPRVSRYRVNMDDLERFTELALENISQESDVVIIDEIGTMELFSDRFKDAVEKLLKSDKSVIAVLHRNHVGEYELYGEVYRLTGDNYDEVKTNIITRLETI